MKISKKIEKKFKKLKNHFPALFLPKTGWVRPKKTEKILVLSSVHTGPVQENSEKSSVKIQKTKKPLSGIFLAKTGWDWPRKAKKKKK